MIESRAGLIMALEEAAELEHGLMIQYLFAALTLKKRTNEGVTDRQQELVRDWEGRILGIVREEMAHLGTVCNLMMAIGSAPRFGRPNFPQPKDTYYPFDFDLIKFSDHALYNFICFELPKGEKPPQPPKRLETERMAHFIEAGGPVETVPEPLFYKHIGELYGQIRDAFESIDEKYLFIGPHFAQDFETWSPRMRIMRVVNRASAVEAINHIVSNGEGAPEDRVGSHYETFRLMRNEFREEADLSPARNVVVNPAVKIRRDTPGDPTILTHSSAIVVAELFMSCYEVALLMLMQLYSYGGETLGERDALRRASRHMMTMAIRPIAEILTELPAFEGDSAGHMETPKAGPTFELYNALQLATQAPSRWTILFERLAAISGEAAKIKTISPRLQFVSENVRLIGDNLEETRRNEERL